MGLEGPQDGGRGWVAVEDAWLDLTFPEKLKINTMVSIQFFSHLTGANQRCSKNQ